MRSHPSMLVRISEAMSLTGDLRSTFYAKIADGLLPAPVPIGQAARAWPLRELEAINEARIAGKTHDEIRALVVRLETERTGVAAAPRRKVRDQLAAA